MQELGMTEGSSPTHTYHTDGLPKEDLFGRKVFAERVAKTILQRPEGEEALVVSITGDWGSGKTTALDYIKGHLTSESCKIASFNPWRFQGEDMLLLELFQALVEAIDPDNSVLTSWQKVGQWIENQRNAVKIGGTAANAKAPGAGQLADATAALLSNWLRPRIEEVRKQAKDYLLKQDWDVVVFVDDIDRLEPTDLLTLLRIIKLTADLPNTIFILAMDEEHVSRIIGEHVKGGEPVGRAYLEKIVQVRLALPTIPPHILKEHALDLIVNVLNSHQAALPKNDLSRFQRIFHPLFAPLIRTPRMAKTLANAIHFELGLLPDEVNTTDLLLLVTSRLLHPRLYEAIRDEAPRFLFRHAGFSSYGPKEEQPEFRLTKFLETVDEKEEDAKQRLTEALKVWFPQFTLGSWDGGADEWARDRRLCSESYFWRYFASAIIGNDVPDASVREWIDSNNVSPATEVATRLKEHFKDKHGRAFVGKLQAMLPSRKEHLRPALQALARVSSQLSRDGEDDVRGSVWSASIRVAAECIRATDDEEAMSLGVDVVKAASDLLWASELTLSLPERFHSNRHKQETNRETVPPTPVEKCMADRMMDVLANSPPDDPSDLSRFIWTVWHEGDREALLPALRRWVDEKDGFAMNLLAAGCGQRLNPATPGHCWNWSERTKTLLEQFIDLIVLENQIKRQLGDTPEPAHKRRFEYEELSIIELGFVFLKAMANRRNSAVPTVELEAK